jgi:hypothetical protein
VEILPLFSFRLIVFSYTCLEVSTSASPNPGMIILPFLTAMKSPMSGWRWDREWLMR